MRVRVQWPYIPLPSDEPPPLSMVRAAQKHADNTGETVEIVDAQGVVARVVVGVGRQPHCSAIASAIP